MTTTYKLFILLFFILTGCSVANYRLAGEDQDFLIEQIEQLVEQGHISENPILVIDGVEYVKKGSIDLENLKISKRDIKEIELLKKEKAIDIFGRKGKNGVLVITTKSDD